jgi:CDP-glycerol glycerophosphotransferase
MTIGQAVKNLIKAHPVLRRGAFEALQVRNRIHRLALKQTPINQRRIVFEAYGGVAYACSPKAIFELIQADPRFADFEFVWAFTAGHDRGVEKHLLADPRVQIVRHGTEDYARALESSGYWIVNDMVPLKIVKRPGQQMVQCWHGTPLKRLRADIVEGSQSATNSVADFIRKNDVDVARWDYLVSPSPFATEAFTSAFRLQQLGQTGIVRETGYPRDDVLVGCTPADTRLKRRQLGIDEERQVVLYAPTFRDDEFSPRRGYLARARLDLAQLARELGPDWVVMVRGHYLTDRQLGIDPDQAGAPDQARIVDLSGHDDINDLYIAADCLITDYSSVLFDYCLLDRPILFYTDDLDRYGSKLRGFYFDPSELPGRIMTEATEVINGLRNLPAYAADTALARQLCREKFSPHEDGRAAQRVIDTVFGH